MTNPDPAEGLARLERMAARARHRREIELAVERERFRAERLQRTRDELYAASDQFLDGPPAGCSYCYVWRRGKFGWHWDHAGPVNPVMKPVDDLEPVELCEWCTHDCHGPDGLPLPVIALAAGP